MIFRSNLPLNILALMMLAFCVSNVFAMQQTNTELREENLITSSVQVGNGTRITNVQAALFTLTKRVAADKKFIVEVLVLREPKTGLSWWGYQEKLDEKTHKDGIAKFLGGLMIYLSDDVMVGVTLTAPPPSLWFRESTDKYPSIDEAKAQALKAFVNNIPDIIAGSYAQYQRVNLFKQIPTDFFYAKGSASPQLKAKLDTVRKEGMNWVVSVSGADGSIVNVEMSEKYEIKKIGP